ncbi:MAG: LytR family transcriptional regulator [Ruminococcaceae bacterium]|nr:LytR family transcriptional regulator [Oscillospiraceae bacterium]
MDRNRRNKSDNKKKKKRIGTVAVKVISAVFSLIFLILGVGCIYLYGLSNSYNYEDVSIKRPVQEITNEVGEVVATEPEILKLDSESGNLLSDPYVLNILLFGADQYGDQGNSDTMILMSIDNRREKIKLTSFLRDTYISIPGYGSYKLNAAYANGGAALSIQTIESNFGIKIDRYAVVNFETFKEIVDIIGGVDIELTADEIAYINAQIAQNNQSEYLPWDTQEGIVRLNGQQALWHARNRGGYVNGTYFYMNDDWGRVGRQRAFIDAVIGSVKDASLPELVQIVNSVGPYITTNLKTSEISTLVSGALTYLNYDIEELTMPEDNWEDVYFEHAGRCLGIIDWNLARRAVAEFIYEDSVM